MGLFDTPGTAPATPDLSNEGLTATAGDEAGQQAQGTPQQDSGRNPGEQAGQQDQQGQPPEEGHGEELIMGKYKTQDEFIEAHKSLQKRFGDMRNELGQLRAGQKTQPTQQAEGQQAEGKKWTDQDWQSFDNQFYQRFSQNPGKTVYDLVVDIAGQMLGPLQQHVTSQTQQQAVQTAIDGELQLLLTATDAEGNPVFPDSESLAEQIDAYLEKNPRIVDFLADQGIRRANGEITESDVGILDAIYRAVKAEAVTALGKQAFSQGLQQGMASAQAKAGAAVAKPGAKTGTNLSPEQRIIEEMMVHKRGGLF